MYSADPGIGPGLPGTGGRTARSPGRAGSSNLGPDAL